MIAALFVETDGCYFDLENVEPWDIVKDARTYKGPYPVVAHPPCQRWGRFATGSTRKPGQYRVGEDEGCFAAALTAVRNYGGVIEHPKDSLAWKYFGLARPPKQGWAKADDYGGYTCQVEQGHYGHFSRKPTWLYVCGVELIDLIWGRSEQRLPAYAIERYGYEKARRIGVMAAVGGKDKTKIRNATPLPFRNVLLELALTATRKVNMYIQDIIGDKGELLDSAMRHPALAQKRNPTIETAMKAVLSEVERVTIQNVQQDYQAKLEELYMNYVLMNGERDDMDVSALSDWDSSLDDEVEKLFEPIMENLSQDWLAKGTIDTRLHEPGEILKLSQSVGKEVLKQLSYGKEPGQVLTNAGIVRADVEAFFETHMQPKTKEQEKAEMAENEDAVAAIATKIKQTIGANFDQMEVYDDIGTLFEDDEILAGAAADRMGLNADDIIALQMASLDGTDADSLMALVNDAPDEKPKRAPAGTKPKKTAPVKRIEDGSTVSNEVLQLYKTHGGTGDTEISAKLGVSRGTYNNWLNGKTAFAPDDAQRDTLRAQIVADLNGLSAALAMVDGADPFLFE